MPLGLGDNRVVLQALLLLVAGPVLVGAGVYEWRRRDRADALTEGVGFTGKEGWNRFRRTGGAVVPGLLGVLTFISGVGAAGSPRSTSAEVPFG